MGLTLTQGGKMTLRQHYLSLVLEATSKALYMWDDDNDETIDQLLERLKQQGWYSEDFKIDNEFWEYVKSMLIVLISTDSNIEPVEKQKVEFEIWSPPDNVCPLGHTDLSDSPDKSSRKICNTCGMEFNPR